MFRPKKYTLLLCMFASSCGIFSNKNLARRHKNTHNLNLFANASDPQSFVQVDFNTSVIRESATPAITYSVLSLTDKGQEAFINAANLKSADAKELMALLTSNFNFPKDAKPNIKIISKTIKKSLFFTVERPKYQKTAAGATIFNLMGDRVAFLELILEIPAGDKGIFDSWDRYVTDHYTLNLGKVTSAQQWNASLSLNAKGSGEMSISGANSSEDIDSDKNTSTATLVNTGNGSSGTTGNNIEVLTTGKDANSKTNSAKANAELGGSGTIGFTDKYETSLDLNSRIMKLSGSLAEKKILLRQESGQGIDLSGNVVVSVEYVLTDDWASPAQFHKIKELYTGTVPLTPSALKTVFYTVIFPDVQSNITGNLHYNFLYRQVNKGNQHLPEARQNVKFWYGSVPALQNNVLNRASVVLIKKEEIRPKHFTIKNSTHTLALNGTDLSFETITEAATFLRYTGDALNAGTVMTGLTLNGIVIIAGDFSTLKIKSTQL